MSAALMDATGRHLGAILSGTLSLPARGNWVARIEVDAESPPAGAVEILVEGEPAQLFRGTVRNAAAFGARAHAFIVGGAGRLSERVRREYVAAPKPVPALLVVQEVIAAGGEQLDASVSLSGISVPRWSVSQTLGGALTVLADALGLSWRVLAGGTLWIGPETWPATEALQGLFQQGDDGDRRVLLFAPDNALLRPGTTVLGRRAERVSFDLGGQGLRAELHYARSS